MALQQQAYNMGQEFVKGLTSNNEKLEQTYMEFLRNSFVETNSKDETLKADNQKNVRESLPSSVQLSVKETLGLTGGALDKMDSPNTLSLLQASVAPLGSAGSGIPQHVAPAPESKVSSTPHAQQSATFESRESRQSIFSRMNPSSASGQQLLQHAVSKSKLSHDESLAGPIWDGFLRHTRLMED